MAAGVVSTLPVLLAFFSTQRWLVRGLTARGGEGMIRFGAATAAYQIEGAVARGRARPVDLGRLLLAARARWSAATPARWRATTTTAGAATST